MTKEHFTLEELMLQYSGAANAAHVEGAADAEDAGLPEAEVTGAADTEDEPDLDLPSFFVPDALRDSLNAVDENFFCTGELPPRLHESTSVAMASEAFLEETPPEAPVFYTGVRGYGFRCYFYYWFYQSEDLAISIILPYPSVLVDEETRQALRDEICHANDMAALLVAAAEKNPAFLDTHPDARLRLAWDQKGFSYAFYQDGQRLEVAETPDMLVDILNSMFPIDLLQYMAMIRP